MAILFGKNTFIPVLHQPLGGQLVHSGGNSYLLAVHLLATIFEGSDLIAQTVDQHHFAFHHCLTPSRLGWWSWRSVHHSPRAGVVTADDTTSTTSVTWSAAAPWRVPLQRNRQHMLHTSKLITCSMIQTKARNNATRKTCHWLILQIIYTLESQLSY